MKTFMKLPIALMTAVALVGCSDDGTGANVDGNGQVTATMTDRSSGGGGAQAFNGSMTANAEVMVHSEAQGWVSLGSASQANLQMQSNDEVTVGSNSSVQADSYTRVRLMLSDADATILAGASIGSTILDADVTISVGGADGNVTIEKDISFTVSAESQTEIEFDLNSEAWVNSANTESQTASDAEVSSATTVVVN